VTAVICFFIVRENKNKIKEKIKRKEIYKRKEKY